ncbi:MAG: hypothetical protein MSC43_03205 [Clostridiales bacterium]|nr:hypothetical protein [Clostridiales bacterium]MDD7432206.1 hypothetical protein [Clostridiales bacterium]MDY3062180.1 hypothetical protein [Eubacteriales bacterium]
MNKSADQMKRESSAIVRQQLQQSILSTSFAAACVLFFLSRFGLFFSEFMITRGQAIGLNYYSTCFLQNAVSISSIAISSLAYSLSYQEDKKSGLLPYIFVRIRADDYMLSKCLACFWSSFAVAFIAYSFCTLTVFALNQANLGMLPEPEIFALLKPFRRLQIESPFIYYLLIIANNSLHCAVWSLFALMTTVFTDDLYMTVGATYLGYVYLSRVLYFAFGFRAFAPALAFSGGARVLEDIPAGLVFTLNVMEILLVATFFSAMAVLRLRKILEKR